MIFVTVGTELPFDRMVKVVDEWAARTGRRDVFAQLGQTEWQPSAMAFCKFLEPDEFAARFADASIIISHAGTGTILSALHAGKPILVVPRLASLGEHRNEHQLATAHWMQEMGKVAVALDEAELRVRLSQIDDLGARDKIEPFAGPELTETIRRFIFKEPPLTLPHNGSDT
jgi:UDP-N-acetylglucosamine transferase subunit ALG13